LVAADNDEELAPIAQEIDAEVIPGLCAIQGVREALILGMWTYSRFHGK
jgi:hypothetical protein